MTNYYPQTVSSWQGANVKDLVARWGVPNISMTGPSGNKVLGYKSNSFGGNNPTTTPSFGVGYTSKGRPVIISQPNTGINFSRGPGFSCVAIFEANSSGTIVSTQSQGNGCFGGKGFVQKMGNPKVNIPTT
jgi:hypothetical protein